MCTGPAIEASDGSAEDVEEDITECSSSLVMKLSPPESHDGQREVGSHRTTCTRNVSIVYLLVILIVPSTPQSYRSSSARLTQEQDNAKDTVSLQKRRHEQQQQSVRKESSARSNVASLRDVCRTRYASIMQMEPPSLTTVSVARRLELMSQGGLRQSSKKLRRNW